MRVLLAVAVLLVAGGVARGDDGPASPEDDPAHRDFHRHAAAGDRLRAAHRCGEAIEEYLAAYRAVRSVGTLDSLGRCYEELEQWGLAVRYYSRFAGALPRRSAEPVLRHIYDLAFARRAMPPPLRRVADPGAPGRGLGWLRYERAMQLHLLGRYHDALREFQLAASLGAPPAVEYHLALSYERLEEFGKAKDCLRRYLASGDDPEGAEALRAHIVDLDERAAAIERRAEAADHDEWLGPRRIVGFGVSGGTGYHILDSSSGRVVPNWPAPSLDVLLEVPQGRRLAFQLRVGIAGPAFATTSGTTLIAAAAQEKFYLRGNYGGPFLGAGFGFTWIDDPLNPFQFKNPDALVELPVRFGWELTPRSHRWAINFDVALLPGVRTDGKLFLGALVEVELLAFVTGRP